MDFTTGQPAASHYWWPPEYPIVQCPSSDGKSHDWIASLVQVAKLHAWIVYNYAWVGVLPKVTTLIIMMSL